MFDNYHLPRENATFRFVIWHGHLWGGRLQMAVIGDARLPAEMAGGLQVEKSRYTLDDKIPSKPLKQRIQGSKHAFG